MDDDVDPIAGFAVERTTPKQQNEHECFDYELARGLEEAVTVAGGEDAAFGEHVDDGGDEEPPVGGFVVFVEEFVFLPDGFVFEEGLGGALHFLHFVGDAVDLKDVECEDGSEDGEGEGCEEFGGPAVAVGELEDAVEGPDAVEEED